MPISKLIFSYILTFAVFFIVDMAWLGFVAKDIYKKYLGNFLSDNNIEESYHQIMDKLSVQDSDGERIAEEMHKRKEQLYKK